MNDTNVKQRDEEPVKKKRTWLRTLLPVIFLWIPLTLAGGNMVFGLAGVCASQLRKWTDDELIEVAVRKLAKAGFQDEGRVWREMAIEDTEPSIQKFLRDNPRCCEVTRIGGLSDLTGWNVSEMIRISGLLDILAGWSVSEVEVNYELNPDRPPSWINRYYKNVILVNTCGDILGTTRGMSSETPETTRYIRK